MDTTTTGASASEHREGKVARSIEQQTAKLPSDTFLWAAVGAMAGSAAMQIAGRQHLSLFVGQWVPTLLLFGVYTKIVKELGSDRHTRGTESFSAY
jgi:fatty acid desaturase